MAGFQGLYDSRFRYQEGAALTLEGPPLTDAVKEQVLEPLSREAGPQAGKG